VGEKDRGGAVVLNLLFAEKPPESRLYAQERKEVLRNAQPSEALRFARTCEGIVPHTVEQLVAGNVGEKSALVLKGPQVRDLDAYPAEGLALHPFTVGDENKFLRPASANEMSALSHGRTYSTGMV